MVQDLDSREEFEKAINGPKAVIVDFSDERCPYSFVEHVLEQGTAKHGVAVYRVDPRVAGIRMPINAGTFQVYLHGVAQRQMRVTSLEDLGKLEHFIQRAKDQQ